MTAKYSPPPWRIRKSAASTTVEIVDANDVVIAEVGDTSLEDEANARLITHAPALLDELRKAADTFADLARVLRMLGRPTTAMACDVAEQAARSTLAKAGAQA